MSAQIFLIAPPETDPAQLAIALAGPAVAALLLQRGALAENAYKARVRAVVPIAQAAGCAALIEGEPGWVRALGADGLHVGGPIERVREAVEALKPELIVGAMAGNSRHEAMLLGELEVDYLMFGSMALAPEPAEIDLAAWWAETMELPAVLSDPTAQPDTIDAHGCEFVALSASVWGGPQGPDGVLARFALKLEELA